MMKVTAETVNKQQEAWANSNVDNNARGKAAILFAQAGEQWGEGGKQKRNAKNREVLVFNMCLNHLNRLLAQADEIEFNLNLSATNQIYRQKMEETATLRMLLDSILLGDEALSKFSQARKKCADYGYSFSEINAGRESGETLNLIPTITIYPDPSIAFWDKNSLHPCKIDGRFAGMKKEVSKEDILCRYPQFKNDSNWLRDKNYLIDYWYRDYKMGEFVRLKTGVFKRVDMLTEPDNKILATKKDVKNLEDKTLTKMEEVCCIYFQRFCNDFVITDPVLFPTDDLPLPKHPGLTVWVPEEDERTYPYIHHLRGAQQLLNYINSQIGTMAKNTSADKWFFNPQHVETQTQEQDAREINAKEGGFIFGGDISQIRRERPAELSASMMQMAQMTKQFIDELGGAMIDSNGGKQKVISGVALDKITHNLGITNTNFLAADILFVQTNGQLVRQMLPKVITEERTLVVNNKDGSGQAIVVNRQTADGIENNIRDVNDNFSYNITAGPSSAMQKEATLTAITNYLQFDPQAPMLMGDIYFRQLDTPDAPELERRLASRIDPALIAMSQGKMTDEDYSQIQQQKQQQQAQQQAEMAKSDPQVQSAMAIASAEHKKAAVSQFDAETKRGAAIAKAQNDSDKLKAQLIELEQKSGLENNQQAIDLLRAQLEAQQQLLDGLKDDGNAAGNGGADVPSDSDQ